MCIVLFIAFKQGLGMTKGTDKHGGLSCLRLRAVRFTLLLLYDSVDITS